MARIIKKSGRIIKPDKPKRGIIFIRYSNRVLPDSVFGNPDGVKKN